jgi:hypothetical protein
MMGTWGSDALYNALSHAATPQHDETLIAKRWKEWEPEVALYAAKFHVAISTIREGHRYRLLELLDAGISMAAIRRKRLDSPHVTDTKFKQSVIEAKERSTRSKRK